MQIILCNVVSCPLITAVSGDNPVPYGRCTAEVHRIYNGYCANILSHKVIGGVDQAMQKDVSEIVKEKRVDIIIEDGSFREVGSAK